MKNKIIKIGILSTAAFFALNGNSIAEIALSLEDTTRHKIEINEPAVEIKGNLFDSKEDALKYYLQNQKKMDIDDIKLLWESTIKRNPVITFAMQKLALPPEKRRINSSRMTKVIATLVRGAAMLPGMLGADPVTSSASSLSGGVASRYIAENSMPKEMPMTDTELIQLARLVEDLQDKIIRNYYEYKSNLEAFQTAKAESAKYNNLYSDALETGDITAIVTSGAMYNRAIRNEINLKQKIKLNKMELERLAGVETVNGLKLGRAKRVDEATVTPEASTEDKVVLQGIAEYLDADIKDLACEIDSEMMDEQQEILVDLQTLWAAAMENSETVRFAILKLSNPDGEVAKKTAVKQILSPIASIAPIIGLGFSDPVTAGSTMFSGNLLNSALSDDSAINKHLSKVSDSDLVILAQEIDTLQEKLIVLYQDYVSSIMDLKLVDNMEKESAKTLEIVKKTKPDLAPVAEVFHAQNAELKYSAQHKVLSSRVALEQFTGNDALLVIDKNIQDRLDYKL